MNLIKPKSLEKGDTIAIIAPSGGVDSDENLFRAKSYFEQRGFKVVLGDNVLNNDRYLAGRDDERVEDIHRMFEDKSVNAIIALRGGYGALRLIEKLDYDLIRKNPKIFCGYSDFTVLSAMIFKRSGLITYSSPMIQSDFGVENFSEFSEKSFYDTVSQAKDLFFEGKNVYSEGFAKGILFGGNLASLTSLAGIDFVPDEKFILFVEDLNEPVYKIDKMFTQLLNIKKFEKNMCALALGDFLDVDEPVWLDNLFNEISKKIQKPVISGFKFTHSRDKITVPNGALAEISTGGKLCGITVKK